MRGDSVMADDEEDLEGLINRCICDWYSGQEADKVSGEQRE